MFAKGNIFTDRFIYVTIIKKACVVNNGIVCFGKVVWCQNVFRASLSP